MPSAKIHTPEGVTLELELAGPGERFGAALIDALFIGIGLFAIQSVVGLIGQFDPFGLADFTSGLLWLGGVLVFVFVAVVQNSLMEGRTLGKAWFGLRIVSIEGGTPSTMALCLRSVFYLLEVLPVPVWLGAIVCELHPRRQRIGDIAAGTLVIRERSTTAGRRPWNLERWSDFVQASRAPEEGERASASADIETLDRRGADHEGPAGGTRWSVAPALEPRHARLLTAEDLRLLEDVALRRGMPAAERERLYRSVASAYRERLDLDDHVPARTLLKGLYLFAREASEEGRLGE